MPTVAVRHVGACDDAVALGGQAASESYLRIDKMLAAARAAGADAIHPGYGFLVRERRLRDAPCRTPGWCSSGPPAAAIAAMGDKARARQRMAAAGIPVVPGYDGDGQDADDAARARRHVSASRSW